MNTKIQDIIYYLEQSVPLAYQDNYDNCGLLVGNAEDTVQGILVCLDITESVLVEAKSKQCNMIIAHHPLVFQPIKKLIGSDYIERCIMMAIKYDIALYALHTNLDHIENGVNAGLAHILEVTNTQILRPKQGALSQLVTFVPEKNTQELLYALYQAGAGEIGNYTHCSFLTLGTGSFQPSIGAQPFIGKKNQLEKIQENKIEIIFPTHLESTILEVLHKHHPYESVAYCVYRLMNHQKNLGAGMIGMLPNVFSCSDFLRYLKQKLNLTYLRHTAFTKDTIQKIAFCGGAGFFLLPDAIQQQADVLITADIKYHEFFKTEDKLLLIDIGHYESEIHTKALIFSLLSQKFTNIAIKQCITVTNPINYY